MFELIFLVINFKHFNFFLCADGVDFRGHRDSNYGLRLKLSLYYLQIFVTKTELLFSRLTNVTI